MPEEDLRRGRRYIVDIMIGRMIKGRWLPHLIQVVSQTRRAKQQASDGCQWHETRLKRLWSSPLGEKLDLEGHQDLEVGACYYLKPRWIYRHTRRYRIDHSEATTIVKSTYYSDVVSASANYGRHPLFGQWIAQFDRDKRRWAHKLFTSFRSYTLDDVRGLFRQIYTEMIPEHHKSRAYFVGLRGDLQAKSGSHMTVYFRQANSEVGHRSFTHLLELHEDVLRGNVGRVIFLDDFTGTGNEATRYLGRELEKNAWLRTLPITLFFLSGFEEAIARIRSEVSGIDITVDAAEKLDDSRRAFSPSNRLFSAEAERREAEEYFRQAALSFLPEGKEAIALGYGNCQALVAFPWNTPNDTLPIFWACAESFKGRQLRKPWIPLYPRFG